MATALKDPDEKIRADPAVKIAKETVAAMGTVEAAKGVVVPGTLSPASRGLVDAANSSAGKVMDGCLASTMKLGKTVFGSVASFSMVLGGLSMMTRYI